MKILILGANGQLGQSLVQQLSYTNFEIISSVRSDIDITDFNHTKDRIIFSNADVVINAIAYTAVDNAELENDDANLVNNLAVANIAKICCDMNSVLIHFSTDYVFDGKSSKPYIESDKVNPLSVYGKTKLLGEYAIKNSGCRHLIFRTGWIYSEFGNNFLKTMLRLGNQKNEINIVGDQVGCPTYAKDISDITIKALYLIDKKNCEYGIYHYGGNESCSWYEFAEYIFDEAKNYNFKIPDINEIPSSSYPAQANRPKYSVLNSSKAINKFEVSASNWKTGVRVAIENININSSQA